MARRPFFSGNYGSALGQVDTRPIMQGAAAQAAMYQGLGQNIGGAIEKYQLNKVKRAKLTGDIEAYLKENPDYINESTMTGDEAADKKNMTQFEKFAAGDLNMAGLEGLAGKLARGDTLRKNKLLEESQIIQNKTQELAFGVQQELRDTTVQLQKDKATISSLSTAIAKETNPQRLKLLQSQLTEAIADLGEGDAERELRRKQRGLAGKQIDAKESIIPLETEATKTRLGAVKGQVERKTELEQLQLSGAKRAEATAKALMDAWGGPEGAATMTVKERKKALEKVDAYITYMDRQGLAAGIKAIAANAPPAIAKQAATLSAYQGHLLDYMVTDPIKGGEITFKEYMDLNNSEGDSDYPLTGDNAGTAGSFYATYTDNKKKINDLVETTVVQVNVPGADGDQSAPAPAPRSTARGGAGLQAKNLAAQQANYRRPEDVEYERILNVWNVTPPARRGIQPTPPPGYQP